MQINYNYMWKGILVFAVIFYFITSFSYDRVNVLQYNFPYNGGAYHKTEEIMEITFDESGEYRALVLQTKDNANLYNIAFTPKIDSTPKSRNLSVAIVCGQHGRELISSEICVHLILHLRGLEKSQTIGNRLNRLTTELGVQFWILPLANPWARQFIELNENESCRRTNGNDVDLNRNFPCPDFVRGKHKKGHAEYPGKSDLSEWESNFTLDFVHRANAHIFINIHSGAESIMLPYDCSVNAIHPFYFQMQQLAKMAAINSSLPNSVAIGKGSQVLYEAHGTLGDFVTNMMGVPFVYTLEVFGDRFNTVSDTDMTSSQCFELFNPSRGREYTNVVERWLLFIISLAENAVTHFEPQD